MSRCCAAVAAGSTEHRVVTRCAEWFTCTDELIAEIRSCYQMQPATTEVAGFPYADRSCSTPGAERGLISPFADQTRPGGAA